MNHNPISLAGEDPADVLRLIRSENVGSVTFFQLLRRFGSVGRALEAIPELTLRGGRKKPIVLASREDAQRELEAASRYGARILIYGQPGYPDALRSLYDPPPVLTVRGDPQLLTCEASVGIVGGRNASANGCALARQFAGKLGEAGWTIVSGLARGIDAAAHHASLKTGAVAVIAGGIDTVYPPQNADLYSAIAEQGCIITEQPFGAEPLARTFPSRNRIIAGLSRAVLIVEAALKSGSLITARFAAEQGKEVFAVPGSPLDPRCRGGNALLRDGANFAESAEEMLRALALLPSSGKSAALEEGPPGLFDAGTVDVTPDMDDDIPPPDIRERAWQALSAAPISVDELARAVELTPSGLHALLLEWELAGLLQRHSGARVSRCYTEAEEAVPEDA